MAGVGGIPASPDRDGAPMILDADAIHDRYVQWAERQDNLPDDEFQAWDLYLAHVNQLRAERGL